MRGWVGVVPWLVACSSSVVVVSPPDDPTHEAILLSLDARSGAPLSARRFDPAGPPLSFTGDADNRVLLLGYPRSLQSYGIAVDDSGAVALRAAGVPLPPPIVWTEIDADGATTTLDVAQWGPDALPQVRLPDPPCPRWMEEPGSRAPLDAAFRARFVAALDDGHVLVAGDDPLAPDGRIVVATATSVTVVVPDVSATLGGFVEDDGAIWVAVTLRRAAGDTPRGALCRFTPTGPRDARACTENVGLASFERVHGRRRADGTLEMVGLSWNGALSAWRGDRGDGGGLWRELYRGGAFQSAQCFTSNVVATLRLDGDGTGIVSFPGGTLERFRITDDGAERERLFEPAEPGKALCRSGFAQHRGGFQVLVEQDVPPPPSLAAAPSRAWWRAREGDPWRALSTATPLGPVGVATLGDVVVVSDGAAGVVTLLVDPARPDLAPRACGDLAVRNDASAMRVDDDVLMTAGVPSPTQDINLVTRWRLRP